MLIVNTRQLYAFVIAGQVDSHGGDHDACVRQGIPRPRRPAESCRR